MGLQRLAWTCQKSKTTEIRFGSFDRCAVCAEGAEPQGKAFRFTGPSTFRPSPVVVISGYSPKEQDGDDERLGLASSLGRLGSASEMR